MRSLEGLWSVDAATRARPVVRELDGVAPGRVYTLGQLLDAAASLAVPLCAMRETLGRPPKIGLAMRNSPEWMAADLALLFSGAVQVPVPLAFSAEQALHLLDGVDLCMVDAAGEAKVAQWFTADGADLPLPPKRMVAMDALLATAPPPFDPPSLDPARICKIIHTSGTTSRPKGVMIRASGLDDLFASIRLRSTPDTYARTLSLVPLSLLIEQVSAVYMTLISGGLLHLLPPEVPLLGEAGATVARIVALLPQAAPSMLTLPPVVVEALLAECRRIPGETLEARCLRLFGRTTPTFIACGGAPTAPAVIAELERFGIRVYEGYGLSENSSVVSWNSPDCHRAGTVGKPLAHVSVRLADDGELLIRSSSLLAGYANADPSSCEIDADGWLHTGDIASIDADGFIRVYGRKKNVIIMANGRNVSPEWVESRYKSLDQVEQTVVFGDGLEALHGFFVLTPNADPARAEAAIRAFGERHLSEIERVETIVIATASAEVYRDCFTVTGRPKRDDIWRRMARTEHTLLEEPCLS